MKNCSIHKGRRYRHLTCEEREEISIGKASGESLSKIARRIGRDRSTISREIRRNSSPIHMKFRGHTAHVRYTVRKKNAHVKGRLGKKGLRKHVEEKLCAGWSPELIAGRLRYEKRELSTNYESIYQWIYSDRRDLIPFLARGHRKRRKRGSAKKKHASRIVNRTPIDKRPDEVESRNVAGHWEGDTIVSRGSKAALAVLYERTSRLTFIIHLERKTAANMKKAVIERLAPLPEKLRKTITWDNGTENTEHEAIDSALGTQSFFCHPYHSWEKGGVENTIELIRRIYPKKTDWASLLKGECDILEKWLNTRPKKCLGFKTPMEVFDALTP